MRYLVSRQVRCLTWHFSYAPLPCYCAHASSSSPESHHQIKAPLICACRSIPVPQNWSWLYRFQHVYMPILYGLLAFKVRFSDIDALWIR